MWWEDAHGRETVGWSSDWFLRSIQKLRWSWQSTENSMPQVLDPYSLALLPCPNFVAKWTAELTVILIIICSYCTLDILFLPICWWSPKWIPLMDKRPNRKTFYTLFGLVFWYSSLSELIKCLQVQKWSWNPRNDKLDCSIPEEWHYGFWKDPKGQCSWTYDFPCRQHF